MRLTTTVTALLLGASLIVPTGTASAVGETCRGEAATIVGTGKTIVGTDGPDVIVIGPSHKVRAGEGDDLICVAGSKSTEVDAGPGNDTVDSTAMTGPAYYLDLDVILGTGSDTFFGGKADDYVISGAYTNYEVVSESEPDVIDTGAGDDSVDSGGPGVPNDDVVRTGPGIDSVTWSGTMGAAGVLDAGQGRDTLWARPSGQTYTIDMTAQTLTRDGVREGSFSSFEDLLVDPEPGLGAVAIVGAPGNDDVEILAPDQGPIAVQADLGAGDDYLLLWGIKPGSSIDGGAGTDHMTARSWQGVVEVDLANGSLVMDDSSAPLAGIESVYVSAMESTLVGTELADYLAVDGCVTTIDGGAGDDLLWHDTFDIYGPEDSWTYSNCEKHSTLEGGDGNDRIKAAVTKEHIYGGPGNDRITAGSGFNRVWGGPGDDTIEGGRSRDVLTGGGGNDSLAGLKSNDVLRGGSGEDLGKGGPGVDMCSTEIKRACER